MIRPISAWPQAVGPNWIQSISIRSISIQSLSVRPILDARLDPASAEVRSAQLELADSPAVGGAGWDLYGGVGLFAAVLADILGPNVPVVCVEGDLAASGLAARNLADLPAVTAIAGVVADVLDDLPDPAVVVLDPPRSGAGPDLCRRIAERAPGVICYVACDPAALGRDTAALQAAGYRLDRLEAFDCFPQTHHVECVARFVPA